MVQSHPHDLRGKPIADAIIAEVRRETEMLAAAGWHPRLLSISIGDVEAAAVYIRNQKAPRPSAPASPSRSGNFPASITQAELEVAIRAMNADPRVTGIIIQRPALAHIALKALQGAVHLMKDVEGMHPASIGNIVYNQLDLAPLHGRSVGGAAQGDRAGSWEGLEVVVVGHSEIVGKPIAFLLMSEGATVTVCHHMTRSVAIHARRADALFVAVGKARADHRRDGEAGAAGDRHRHQRRQGRRGGERA